ncbi:MAG: pantetheine-phosphate adenylyltransferase [Elusimicrobiaceae bacterium]|nr:pantetheine-phosphate adenylyltransferase [Elusimicrobiaceae bacterium]
MKAVVFPGSFDPVTNGHLDLIRRACAIFGEVVVLVLPNAAKKTRFSLQERIDFLKESLAQDKNVRVEGSQGLLVDYMKKNGYTTVVRGIRNAHDWNPERTNVYFNKQLYPQLETVFLPAGEEYQFISSTAIKEAAAGGADVSPWVPACVAKELKS